MLIHYSPVNINQCNIFEIIESYGFIRIKATTKMSKGDLALLHLGKQNKNYESGVYAYGTIDSDPYILENHPDDICNGTREETKDFIEPLQRPHLIDSQYYNFILGKLNLEGKIGYGKLDVDFEEIIDNQNRRIWKVQPGNDYEKGWEYFYEDGYIAIDYTYGDKDVDFSEFKTKSEIKHFIAKKDPKLKKIVSHNFVWNFVNEMKIGDIVIANFGQSKFVGIGVITSDFIPQTKNDYNNELGLRDIRKVKWIWDMPIYMGEYFFHQNTVEEMSNLKWNMILCSLARENEDICSRLLEYLYGSFYDSYLSSLDNKNHNINYSDVDDLINSIILFSYLFDEKVDVETIEKSFILDNEKIHKFKDDLYDFYVYSEFDISDAETFDIFCHWMCTEDLGNYASENANKIPFDSIWDINKILFNEGDYLKNIIKKVNLSERILKKELEDFSYSPKTINQLCAALNAGKHIIIDGTPGTGKTEIAIKFSKVAKQHFFNNGYVLTTATSDWSTFDTIGGLMPEDGGKLYFHSGKFLDAIAENKWLIIDEINRADIDKAFGQLFTVLSNQDVELPYNKKGKPISIVRWDENYCEYDEENAIYKIGKNWRIIGTMNVDDKDSLYDLSYAFMRRFMFVEVDLPEDEKYLKLIEKEARTLPEEYMGKLKDLYGVVKFRKLGPAIFMDIIEYIFYRDKLIEDSVKKQTSFDREKCVNDILAEAISSYIIPQLEGLNEESIKEIKKIFQGLELNDQVINQLDDLILNF